MKKGLYLKSFAIALCLLSISTAHAQFTLVKDICKRSQPSVPNDAVQFNDHILFVAYDSDHGNEL